MLTGPLLSVSDSSRVQQKGVLGAEQEVSLFAVARPASLARAMVDRLRNKIRSGRMAKEQDKWLRAVHDGHWEDQALLIHSLCASLKTASWPQVAQQAAMALFGCCQVMCVRKSSSLYSSHNIDATLSGHCTPSIVRSQTWRPLHCPNVRHCSP